MDPRQYIPPEVEQFIAARENEIGNVREEARARIVWADAAAKNKTETGLVYLHGFKASHGEGHPVHRKIAETFGFNAYLARLKGHGLYDEAPFGELTADDFRESAEFALKAGLGISKRVVLMGTSTGASLALYLAAREHYRQHIAAVILYSPLIRFYGMQQFLQPGWSRNILSRIPGNDYLVKVASETGEAQKIWYDRYRLRGAIALGRFISETMREETFRRVRCPAFIGYYYRDPLHRDRVIALRPLKKLPGLLGSGTESARLVNFPEAGTHVIASELYSNSVGRVLRETSRFLEDFGMHPVTEKREN